MWSSGEAAGLPGRLSGMGRWHTLAFVCQQIPAPWQEVLEHEEPRGTFLQGQRFPQHRNILAIKLNIPREEGSSWKGNDLIILNNCLDFFHPFLENQSKSKKKSLIFLGPGKKNAWDFFLLTSHSKKILFPCFFHEDMMYWMIRVFPQPASRTRMQMLEHPLLEFVISC